jgi:hypothetical protein
MRIFVLVFILLIGIWAQAKGPDASRWSMRFMARASNALLVASQQSLDHQKAICGISGSQVSRLSQNLKSLIDAKIPSLNMSQKSMIRQQVLECQKDCTCDIFAYSLEGSSTSEDQKSLEQIRRSVEKITIQSRLACVKKFPEFCGSSLLKALYK